MSSEDRWRVFCQVSSELSDGEILSKFWNQRSAKHAKLLWEFTTSWYFMTQNNPNQLSCIKLCISLNALRFSQFKCIDVTIHAATEANCRKVKAILSNHRTGKHMEHHGTMEALNRSGFQLLPHAACMYDLHRSSGKFSSSPILVIWSQYHLPSRHLHYWTRSSLSGTASAWTGPLCAPAKWGGVKESGLQWRTTKIQTS